MSGGLPASSDCHNEPRRVRIFPYLRILAAAIASATALSTLNGVVLTFAPHAIHKEWAWNLALATNWDAFAFAIFTPLPVMRRWHNQVALYCLMTAMLVLAGNAERYSSGLLVLPLLAAAVESARAGADFLGWWSRPHMRSSIAGCSHDLRALGRRGLFPDRSTWPVALRHAAIAGAVNLSLWWRFTGKQGWFVLIIGVLFEVSLNRFTFGHRTAKSDLLNVFAALVPFMEATCDGTCKSFGIGEIALEHSERLAAAAVGFVLSEGVAFATLRRMALSEGERAKAQSAKAIGTCLKIAIPLLVARPLSQCRLAFLLGNGYVFALDVITIWFSPDKRDAAGAHQQVPTPRVLPTAALTRCPSSDKGGHDWVCAGAPPMPVPLARCKSEPRLVRGASGCAGGVPRVSGRPT